MCRSHVTYIDYGVGEVGDTYGGAVQEAQDESVAHRNFAVKVRA
jgi:hypothetical protein